MKKRQSLRGQIEKVPPLLQRLLVHTSAKVISADTRFSHDSVQILVVARGASIDECVAEILHDIAKRARPELLDRLEDELATLESARCASTSGTCRVTRCAEGA